MADRRRLVAYDITHIVTRLDRTAFSGIDQVDVAYARHFAGSGRLACGAHYSLGLPHRFSPDRVRETLAHVEGKRAASPPSLEWPALRRWIVSGDTDIGPARPRKPPIDQADLAQKWRLRLTSDGWFNPPAGTIYLNVAQHAFEFPRYFRWMGRRPNILPVFVVHDLLPFDHPEFFRAGYEARFGRRLDTILRHARAIITTSEAVRGRITDAYRTRGRAPVPVHVEPLATSLGPATDDDVDAELAAQPYFVVVSTIEPRKNHLMLLHQWREWSSRLANPPKLVLVGGLGWDCDQTLAILGRTKGLNRSVAHVSGLPEDRLRILLRNARALLMPSFAEGYGLPIVEALTLGTPVIAADIPVFREVSQGAATFLSPTNGDAWGEAILARSDPLGAGDHDPSVSGFAPPSWASYFSNIEAFLDRL